MEKPELITRECLCGCGKTFRVMPTNTINYFFNEGHVFWTYFRDGEKGKAEAIAYLMRSKKKLDWKNIKRKFGKFIGDRKLTARPKKSKPRGGPR